MRSYGEARTSIVARLGQKKWSLAPEALGPLEKIDFAKLVDIHDHEEHFLEETLIGSLEALGGARVATGLGGRIITANDVETALRMLGVAVARQPELAVSKTSKDIIKEACGFCK